MGESRDSAEHIRIRALRATASFGVLTAWCVASPVYAHGPAPAIVGVVAADADGPRILALTEGFALRTATDAHFVCPARFGVDRVPLAASSAQTSWVAGSPTAATWTSHGVQITQESRVNSASVIDFADGSEPLLALTFGGSGSDVLALSEDQAELLFHLSDAAVALTFDGTEVWVARAQGFVAQVQRSGLHGENPSLSELGFASTPRTIGLRSAGNRTFLHASFDNRAELYELGIGQDAAIAVQQTAIFGPVRDKSGLLWVGGSSGLMRLDTAGQADSPVALESAIHCLEERAGVAYVCSQTGVFRLSDVLDQGVGAVALWSLSALLPATAEAVAEAADPGACAAQWLTFRADLVRASIPLAADDTMTNASTLPSAIPGVGAAPDLPLDANDAGSARGAAVAAEDSGQALSGLDASGSAAHAADTFSESHAASTCALPAHRSQRFPYLLSALFGAFCASNALRRRVRARLRNS